MPSLEQLSPRLLHAATETDAGRRCEAGGSECAPWTSRERCDWPSIGIAGGVADKAAPPDKKAASAALVTMTISRDDISPLLGVQRFNVTALPARCSVLLARAARRAASLPIVLRPRLARIADHGQSFRTLLAVKDWRAAEFHRSASRRDVPVGGFLARIRLTRELRSARESDNADTIFDPSSRQGPPGLSRRAGHAHGTMEHADESSRCRDCRHDPGRRPVGGARAGRGA